jgi:uncharacterized protein
MYANGRGVAKDDEEAVRLLRKAAEQGYGIAQNNLGNVYEYGLGMPKDLAEAVRWYRKAAKYGHEGAKANLKRLGTE